MKLTPLILGLMVILISASPKYINAAESDKAKQTSKNKSKKSNLKLNTLKIQASKELPKGLYIVPWQEVEIRKGARYKQQLVLHSLYGDLFDPITSDKVLEVQP